jgi:hypothetical protein
MSPFFHSSELSSAKESAMDKHLSIEADFFERISVSAKNQSTFLWHVRWPEYDDTVFLEESVARYELMLRLMKDNPTQFIVPTYDIDNIWHTHLAFPCRYIADCRRLAGRPINHDDDVGHDRSATSFLRASSTQTAKLWQSSFGTAWRKEGAMYRGEPPAWYWADRPRAAEPVANATRRTSALRYVVEIVGRAFGAPDSEVRSPRPVAPRPASEAGRALRFPPPR